MSNHLEILRQNGKSFYWAGKLLPKKYFVRCAELYSFCRLLDDIADTNTKDENFIKLNFILDLIEKNDYQKLEENNIYVPSYLKNCELAKSKIIDLIHGLIFDQKLVRIKSEKELIDYIRYIGVFNQVSLTQSLRLTNKPPVLSILCEICRKIGNHMPDHFSAVREWSEKASEDGVRWDGDLVCSTAWNIDGERLTPELGTTQFHTFVVHKELFKGLE